ncbi:uncharacterized protein E0L32_006807 [Thyridium curvatum]|uniref:Uncharacterized protein n=1 Tax=Thyridium curvatum TaxID=1093900 RepID=A0A507ANL1_9PEZI|nr:uncharacterized protein E0L32_006807 [Thyridium curvatum]TPX12395.1 hypothetical protein E0L32_006807 [Thyridium curvatum]
MGKKLCRVAPLSISSLTFSASCVKINGNSRGIHTSSTMANVFDFPNGNSLPVVTLCNRATETCRVQICHYAFRAHRYLNIAPPVKRREKQSCPLTLLSKYKAKDDLPIQPVRTIIPGGTRIPGGTIIPEDAVLPGGTIFPGGTKFPGGTLLPVGTVLPVGTGFRAGVYLPGKQVAEKEMEKDEDEEDEDEDEKKVKKEKDIKPEPE